MIGRESMNQCMPPNMNKVMEDRYKRCVFQDLKIAIDALKSLDDVISSLHPDVAYKIRQII